MSDAPSPNDAPAPDDSLPLLGRVRTEPRSHAVALVAALGVGVALATVHWLGLIAAGALASLVAPTVRRGAWYALLAGVAVLAAFAVSLGPAVGPASEMVPAVYVTVGAGVGLPLFGSLARAIAA